MRSLNRIVLSFWLCSASNVYAQQYPIIPTICSDFSGTVALLDCLQNQKDILSHVLEYQQLVTKISEFQSNADSVPRVATDDRSDKPEPGIDRVNWFDQNLEIYAIVGDPSALVAYARLDGRVYRLKPGDTIRLARVIEVYQRGVTLQVSGHEITVELSGRELHRQPDTEDQL